MPDRSRDWFEQAERDLGHARDAHRSGTYEWACFAAQQAAEKAVKALHLSRGQEVWGHAVARLLAELPEETEAPSDLNQEGSCPGRLLHSSALSERTSGGRPAHTLQRPTE